MALPKLDIPTFTLELPSTQEEIKYRPFLVKEQKTLMILQESENKKDIMDGMISLVDGCTFGVLNVAQMPVFDFEYIFLKIRCKSVGETAELNVLCPDDEQTRVPVTINLDEIDVQVNEEHTNTIDISDKIKMILRWPVVKDALSLNYESSDNIVNHVMELTQKCVTEITDGDKIYNRSEMTESELNEFIDMLSPDVFEKIGEYFETMPKLVHVMNVKNPNTNKENEIIIQGLENFFG
tara:strand:+ start:1103 stop:1816 length:714 start_codon:yes stop_codon:yes gene_type:complete